MASILQEEEKDQETGSMNLGQQNQGDISAQSGSPAPSQSIRPPSPKGSGRFMNLQKYISANAPQAQQMASSIGQGFAQQAGQAQQNVQSAASQFGQQAQKEQERLGQAGQFAQRLGEAPGAQEILSSPEQLAQFRQLQQGQFNLSQPNLTQEQQQLQQLQAKQQQAKTEAGRFQMLRDKFGNPSYTLGQRRLDQLLLQNAPGAATQIQGAINPAIQGLQQSLSGTQQDIASRYNALQQLVGEAQGQIEQGITGGLSKVESDVEAARQKAIEDRALRMQQFGIGSLSPEDIQELGPSFADPYASLYNLNLRDYLSSPETLQDISVGQAATPEQIAQYQALQQLGDRTGQLGAQLVPGQQAIDYLPLNEEQLMAEYGKRHQAFSQEFTPLAKFYETLGGLNLQQGDFSNNQKIYEAALASGVDPALMNAYTGGLQRAIVDKGLALGPSFAGETIAQMAQRGAQTYLQNRAQQAGALGTVGQIAPEDVLRHLIAQYSGQNVGALT